MGLNKDFKVKNSLCVSESLNVTQSACVGGDTSIYGNLSVYGDETILRTIISTTSALSVINNGTGPALFVRQAGSNQPIAEFIDKEGGQIIFDDAGHVGIGTTNPTQKLTVAGGVSAIGLSAMTANQGFVSAGRDLAGIFTGCAGTVTSVGTGDGLLGGAITSTGTLTVDSTVARRNAANTFDGDQSINGILSSNKGIITETVNVSSVTGGYLSAGRDLGDIFATTASSGSICGSGTTNLIPKWSGSTTLTDSILREATGQINVAGGLSAVGLSALALNSGILSGGKDLNTLFSNCAGTVTSVGTGDGLAGGAVTSSGTLTVDSTVARRNAANTFDGDQSVNGLLSSNKGIITETVNVSSVTGGYLSAGKDLADIFTTCAGDVTGVTACAGLSGGGTAGDICIGLNATTANSLNQAGCPGIDCEGTVTSVGTGDGLAGGSITGSGTLTVDSTVARRNAANTFDGDQSVNGLLSSNKGIITETVNVSSSYLSAGTDLTDIFSNCAGTVTTAGALLSGNTTTIGVDSGALNYLNQSACPGIDCEGTVTSVGTGDGLAGGAVTSSGTLTVDSTVARRNAANTFDGDQSINGILSSNKGIITETVNVSSTTGGYLSAGKNLNTLFSNCAGTVTSVTGGTGIDSSGGTTPEISIDSTVAKCNALNTFTGGLSAVGLSALALNSGILSGGKDLNTLFSNCAGTVTSVGTGDGLAGGAVTSTGTLTVDSTVARRNAANTFDGDQSINGILSSNKGIITETVNVSSVTGGYLSAGKDLADIFAISSGNITGVTAGSQLGGGGTTGDVTLNLNLSASGAGKGDYGSTNNGTKIDTITLDEFGRVTAVSTGDTGTVTSVGTGDGLAGGAITGSGTLTVDSTVARRNAANTFDGDQSVNGILSSNSGFTTETATIGGNISAIGGLSASSACIGGNVNLPDGGIIALGSPGQDLKIQHDGNNSYISENGTGDLYIGTNNASVRIVDDNSGKTMIAARGGSSERVELYNSGNKKLQTATDGVTIYGGATALGLSAAAANQGFVSAGRDLADIFSTTDGDITEVVAGTGLNGGGASGSVTLNLDAAQTNITSILNTSLNIGRDTDNSIKFGNDNCIKFHVSGGENVLFKGDGEIQACSLTIRSGASALGLSAAGANHGFVSAGKDLTDIFTGCTGTVTSVGTGDGLAGGAVTSTGTLTVDSTVARRNAANTFDGDQSVNGILSSNKGIITETVNVSSSYLSAGTDLADIFATSSGNVDGSGTANVLPVWSDSNTLTDSIARQTTGHLTIGGNISSTGALSASGAGYNYFNGRVGIGTDTPSHKLNVAISDGDDGIVLQKAGTANDLFKVSMDGTTDQGEMFLYDNSGVPAGTAVFAVRANTNYSYINTQGNFGVGTTTPNESLTVGGNISATGSLSAGGINVPDSCKITLGDAHDLQLYHNGTDSYIDNGAVGDLVIRNNGENTVIIGHNANKGLMYVPDGRVELRFNDAKKFETTNTGSKTSGSICATNDLTVDGDASVRALTVTRGVTALGLSAAAANSGFVSAGKDLSEIFTGCTGTVTSVGTGDGLAGGAITGSGTLTVDSTVARRNADNTFDGDQSVNGLLSSNKGIITETVNVSSSYLSAGTDLTDIFSNCAGTITGVTAGSGMTGGGSSGSVTLNVIGGDGITANADNIVVDSTVVRTTGAQSIAGAKCFDDITCFCNNTITTGNATIQGNLSVTGEFTRMDTIVDVTSAMEIQNHGTGPALTVNQAGSNTVIDFQDDDASVFKIKDGGQSVFAKGISAIGGLSAVGGPVNFGEDDTGIDVKFHGGTSNKYFLWDESGDRAILADNTYLGFGTGSDALFYHTGSDLNLQNYLGAFQFINNTDNGCINFKLDDGYTNVVNYIQLDGNSETILLGTGLPASAGEVGIGTSSPESKLHVGAGDIRIDNNQNYLAETAGGGNISVAKMDGSDNLLIGDGNLKIDVTGSAAMMTIDSSGNVEVGDNKKIKGATYASSYIQFEDDVKVSANSDIIFDVNGSDELMRLEEGGNAGIGTTGVPVEKLTVAGNISAQGSLSAGGSNNNYFAGKVGIGTNRPEANLEICTNLNQQHLYIQGAYGVGVGALARIKTIASGNVLLLESGGTSGSREIFQAKNSSGSVFEIQEDGLVGIGTEEPTEKLTVAGNISATGYLSAGLGINVPDSNKITLGDAHDLELWHNGSVSYVRDVGTGGLHLQTNGPAIYLQDADGNAMAQFTDNGNSFLYSNHVLKFNTNTTGACVYGGLSALSLSAAGANQGFVSAGRDLSDIFSGCTGTVTSVGTGDGLAGGAITSSGTLTVDSTVARRNAANTFDGNQSVNGLLSSNSGFTTETATIGGNISAIGGLSASSACIAGNIDLPDAQIRIGETDDLVIQHDGANSYITEQGTGDLYIQPNSSGLYVRDATSGNVMIAAKAGSGQIAELYAGGDVILRTAGTGINIVKGGATVSAGVTALGLSAAAANQGFVSAGKDLSEIFTGCAGTVTSVGTGDGLAGGAVTSSGTLTVDSTVARRNGANTFDGDQSVNGLLSSNKGIITETVNVSSSYLSAGTDLADIFATSSGNVDGSGTANVLPVWSDTDTLTDSIARQSTGRLTVGGGVSATNGLSAQGGSGPVVFGQDDHGVDVTFYGDTADRFANWDASDNRFELEDNVGINFGSGGDLEIKHDGADSCIINNNRCLYIIANDTDSDIKFMADNGSGTETEYFRVDGGYGGICYFKGTLHADGVQASYGTGNDMQIQHNGADGFINNSTGRLQIKGNEQVTVKGGISADSYCSDYCNNARFGTCALTAYSGQCNVTIGSNAGRLTTSTGSTYIGQNAGQANTTGVNTAVGLQALTTNTDGTENVAVGVQALLSNDGGYQNVAVGVAALQLNTSGLRNTAVGCGALLSNTTGDCNVALGCQAGYSNQTGNSQVAIGSKALYSSTVGENVAVGSCAAAANTTGTQNVAMGHKAMCSNTIGMCNVAIGFNALMTSVTAKGNVAIGNKALCKTTCGEKNVAVGDCALQNNTEAWYNVGVGYGALQTNTTGEYNVAVGRQPLNFNTTGNMNIAIGRQAMYQNTDGQCNTAVGTYAMNTNTEGDFNQAFGHSALYSNKTGHYNNAMGYCSLYSANSGEHNNAFGFGTLHKNYGGHYNTAIGRQALACNTTGCCNDAMGYRALYQNTTGCCNVAIGRSAMYNHKTGCSNVGIGNSTLYNAKSGGCNVAIGECGLYDNWSGVNNVAIGRCSLRYNTTGNCNVALGNLALKANTTGGENFAVGYSALENNTTGYYNVALGSQAMKKNTTSSYNIAFGHSPLWSNTTGEMNIAMGYQSLYSNISGNCNIALGRESLKSSWGGDHNVAMGLCTLYSNTEGDNNTGIGQQALYTNTTGCYNTGIGFRSLRSNTTGKYNVALGGTDALYSNTTGESNIAIGRDTLKTNTEGDYNVALGNVALCKNVDGDHNQAIGGYALFSNTEGNYNAAIGNIALCANTTGDHNQALGQSALRINTTGCYNTAIGNEALYYNTTGLCNVAIGRYAMQTSLSGDANIAIGPEAMCSNWSGCNNIAIGCKALEDWTGRDNKEGAVAIGTCALASITTAAGNTAVGHEAAKATTNGDNTAVGYCALRDNTGGEGNVAIGYCASKAGTGARHNVGIGFRALDSSTTCGNVAIGYQAAYNQGTGKCNVVIGCRAMYNGGSGDEFTAVGHKAGYSNNADFNTAIGSCALYSNTTGTGNLAVGHCSLYANVTASNNVAFGDEAIRNNILGCSNVGVGAHALIVNTMGNHNQAMGTETLKTNTTGSCNVGIGTEALRTNSTGSSNIAIGFLAMYANNTTGSNIAIGVEALKCNTANANTAIGTGASLENTSGYYNTALGYHALQDNQTGSHNVAVGHCALHENEANYNTALGHYAMLCTTSGCLNAAVGSSALCKNTAGDGGAALGYAALANNTTGDCNVAIGMDSLTTNVTGGCLVAIGTKALNANTCESFSTAVGHETLMTSKSASHNTGVGFRALCKANAPGNTAVGGSALRNTTAGNYNEAFGYQALFTNTVGCQNVGIGTLALNANTSGNNNTAVGNNALRSNTTGTFNTAVGLYAGCNNETGDCNTMFGYAAGRFLANGSTALDEPENSTYIGTCTRGKAADDNNVTVIGYCACACGDNTVSIGNCNVTATYINGCVLAGDITIDGSTISDSGALTICSGDDVTIDAESDVNIDANGGDLRFKDDGTIIGAFANSSNDFVIKSGQCDKDIRFCGVDDGVDIEALRLDMSSGGSAFFNHDAVFADAGKVTFGGGGDLQIYHCSDQNYIDVTTSDQDLIFKGTDGVSDITALTLDMSDAGSAIFNHNISLPACGELDFDAGDVKFVHAANTLTLQGATNGLKITGDGSNATALVESGAGEFKIDSVADITLDAGGGDIILSDDTTIFGTFSKSGNDLQLRSRIADGDVFIRGVDDAATINAAQFDMSDAGTTIFNNKVCMGDGKLVLNGSAVNSTAAELNLLDGCTSACGIDCTGTTTASNSQTFTNKGGNISQWTNDCGYTDCAGSVTPSSCDTFTNKSGNISMWTNDCGYTTNTGTVTNVATGDGIDGGAITSTGTICVDSTVIRTTGDQSIAGTKTFTGQIDLADDVTANFGDGADLSIYHNGTSSFIDNDKNHICIRNNVDGDDGGNIYLMPHDNENGIIINDDSTVVLYNNNSVKFCTCSSGSRTTGTHCASTCLRSPAVCGTTSVCGGTACFSCAGIGTSAGCSACLIVGGAAACGCSCGTPSIIACNDVNICGTLCKASGYFDIVHPLPTLSASKRLRHSFVEAPQADNIYSGVVELTAGKATVNIDNKHDMTSGTLTALNRCFRTFTTNETNWDPVRGSVSGNMLTVESCVADSTATVSWMVLGERHDPHMCNNSTTDEDGRVRAEYDNPE